MMKSLYFREFFNEDHESVYDRKFERSRKRSDKIKNGKRERNQYVTRQHALDNVPEDVQDKKMWEDVVLLMLGKEGKEPEYEMKDLISIYKKKMKNKIMILNRYNKN